MQHWYDAKEIPSEQQRSETSNPVPATSSNMARMVFACHLTKHSLKNTMVRLQ